MADISDVLTAISNIAVAACYPNGTGNPSISGNPITVAPGWPIAEQLNNGFKAVPPQSFVSIFPLSGASAIDQVTADPVVIVAPAHGMSASIAPSLVITVVGTPNVGEYLTVEVNNTKAYSYAAVQGDTLSTVCSNLAALVAADWPGTSAVGGVITLVGPTYVTVRIGAPGTMGEIIHRQKQQVQVTVWTPDPATRTTIGAAVDVALKNTLRLTMPDTSACILTFNATHFDDSRENGGVYRRDMIYLADYLTINQYLAYEITSFTIERTDVLSPNVAL
jgi:hypothetical protein